MIPPALRTAVEARLGPVRGVSPVGGGCISHGMRVETAGGPVFVKYNADAPPGLFAAEARGLAALAAGAGDALVVPRVLHAGEAEGGDGPAWLALEWLEPGPRAGGWAERLGRGVAALHRAPAAGWGAEEDNFIGSLPQSNRPTGTWAEFWRARRLEPQLELARRAGRMPGASADWERLLARLPELLAPARDDGPSLLHGDLWGGNVMAAHRGPALIDPAAYRGHREADLAMAELFGGFPDAFFAAYREAWPLLPGDRARCAAYRLYYLLVHVNLFGGGYVAQTAEALRRALAA